MDETEALSGAMLGATFDEVDTGVIGGTEDKLGGALGGEDTLGGETETELLVAGTGSDGGSFAADAGPDFGAAGGVVTMGALEIGAGGIEILAWSPLGGGGVFETRTAKSLRDGRARGVLLWGGS